MSGLDQTRPRERRLLPSVAEVVQEMTRRTDADAQQVVKAARQVCVEELSRVKDGHPTAPLETLVTRALALVESAARPEPPAGAARPEDPFEETSGALDLRWERDVREPFAPDGTAATPTPLGGSPEEPEHPSTEPFVLSDEGPTSVFPGEGATVVLGGEGRTEILPAVEPRTPPKGPPPTIQIPFPAAVSPPPGPAAPTVVLPAPEWTAPPPSGEIAMDVGASVADAAVEPVPSEVHPLADQEPEAVPAFARRPAPARPLPEETPRREPVLAAPPAGAPPPGPAAPAGPAELRPPDTPFSPAQPPFLPAPHEVVGSPGEETLARLSREAAALDLRTVLPQKAAEEEIPYSIVVTSSRQETGRAASPARAETAERLPFATDGADRAPGSSVGRFLVGVVAVGALVAVGWWGVGFWMKRREATAPAPEGPSVSSPSTAASPAPALEGSSVGPAAEPAPSSPAPPATVAASPSAGTATAAPAGAPRAEASPAPAAPAPAAAAEAPRRPAVAVATPEPVPAPAVVRPAARAETPAAASPVRQSRAATVASPDWAGKEPVFVIHFSSYQDRKNAERDAARLGKTLGMTVRPIQVDLGEKGTWYRVMAGEFATFEEAQAAREALEAKGTPGMGWVYRLVPPKPR